MKPSTIKKLGFVLTGVLALIVTPASADTFGSGGNPFTIDFVNIGNAGNANDAGAGGGLYSSPYGGVSYNYRMGTYEISQDQITKATNSGLANVAAGPWTGNQSATAITWYEAAAFVNWLNTSTGHQAAYQIDAGVTSLTLWGSAQAWQIDGENLYRHKDAYYFLPNENEWYKAAYHKNDGVTANYWDYATGSNTIPTAVASGTGGGTVVYDQPSPQGPAAVDQSGGLSSYGTMGQDGNVWDWTESAYDGVNDSSSENRTLRGGGWRFNEGILRSSNRGVFAPEGGFDDFGFRVASVVPEPSSAVLIVGSGWMFLARRRRAAAR